MEWGIRNGLFCKSGLYGGRMGGFAGVKRQASAHIWTCTQTQVCASGLNYRHFVTLPGYTSEWPVKFMAQMVLSTLFVHAEEHTRQTHLYTTSIIHAQNKISGMLPFLTPLLQGSLTLCEDEPAVAVDISTASAWKPVSNMYVLRQTPEPLSDYEKLSCCETEKGSPMRSTPDLPRKF